MNKRSLNAEQRTSEQLNGRIVHYEPPVYGLGHAFAATEPYEKSTPPSFAKRMNGERTNEQLMGGEYDAGI